MEPAREAGEKAAQREHRDLGPIDVDAEGGGDQLLLGDAKERPPEAGGDEVAHDPHRAEEGQQGEVVGREGVRDREPEVVRVGDGKAGRAPGDEARMQERPVHDEHERDGDDREVQAPQPQGGEGDEGPHPGGEQRPGRPRDPERPVRPGDEDPHGVGAEPHEGDVRLRELSRVAHDEVERGRHDDVDDEDVEDVDLVQAHRPGGDREHRDPGHRGVAENELGTVHGFPCSPSRRLAARAGAARRGSVPSSRRARSDG